MWPCLVVALAFLFGSQMLVTSLSGQVTDAGHILEVTDAGHTSGLFFSCQVVDAILASGQTL